jgi:hypothetical protein
MSTTTRMDGMQEAKAVREWLARSGYPLEYEVARSFRAAGFEVFQGLHYGADRLEASGPREVDVLAVRQEVVPHHPITRSTVLFVVECKDSSAPWVVFRGQSSPEPWAAVGSFATNAITEMNILGALELGQNPWLLRLPENVGFRLGIVATKPRQPKQEERSRTEPGGMATLPIARAGDSDRAHAALKQAVSAAMGVLRDDASHLATLAVPVIVVGSRLYTVSYDDDGREEVAPTNWERILWRGDRSGQPMAVDVVSREFLDDYVKLAADGADEFLPILRGATLDAREEQFRRQDPSGRADRITVGLASTGDALARLMDRARRSVARLTR